VTLNIGGFARAERGDDFSASGADRVGAQPRNIATELVGKINGSTTSVERSQLLGQLDAHTGSKQASDALVRDHVVAAAAQGSSGAVDQTPVGNDKSIALSSREPATERIFANPSFVSGATEGGPGQTEEPGMLFQPGEQASPFSGFGMLYTPDGSYSSVFSTDFQGHANTNSVLPGPPTAKPVQKADTPAPAKAAADPASTTGDGVAAKGGDASAGQKGGTSTGGGGAFAPPPFAEGLSGSPLYQSNGGAAHAAGVAQAGGTAPLSIANTAENGNTVYYSGNSLLIDNKSLWYVAADSNYAGPVYTPSAADGTAGGIGPVTGGALDDGKGGNVAYSQGAPDVHFDKSGAPYIYLPHSDTQGLYAVHIQPSLPIEPFANKLIAPSYLSSVFPVSGSNPLSIANNTDGVRDYPSGFKIPGQSYIRGPLTVEESYRAANSADGELRIANSFSSGAATAQLLGASPQAATVIGVATDGILLGLAGRQGVSQVASADAGSIERFLPADWAELKGFPGIGTTPNGGPTFANTPYLYPASPGQSSVVSIELTGSRAGDIRAADSASGINSQGIDYTWHHIDNFDLSSGSSTLELVLKDAHTASLPHSGSVAQYQQANGTGYNRR